LQIGTLTTVLTSSTYIVLQTIVVARDRGLHSTKCSRSHPEINDAAKKVAKGDFSVRLDEKSNSKEIQEIAVNFTPWSKELSNTETLLNDFCPQRFARIQNAPFRNRRLHDAPADETLPGRATGVYHRILKTPADSTRLTQTSLALTAGKSGDRPPEGMVQLYEQIDAYFSVYETLWEEKNLTIDINLDAVQYYVSQARLAQVEQPDRQTPSCFPGRAACSPAAAARRRTPSS
jgi:hypothetical protein